MTKWDRRAWWIAITVFVSLFFLWGAGYNTQPVFYAGLLNPPKWSHTQVAWVSSTLALSAGLTAPIAGWMLDWIGARVVMSVGTALAGLGFFLAGRAASFIDLVSANIILGIGLGSSTWLPGSMVIANWFGERRGTALGFATIGQEAGGMLGAIIVGYLISLSGWRLAYFMLSLPVFFLVLPMVILFVRTRPLDAVGQTISDAVGASHGLGVREALRTRAFWILVIAFLGYGTGGSGIFIHLVAYLKGLGYSERAGTFAVTVLVGLAGVGKPLWGILGDHISAKNAMCLGYLTLATASFLLLAATHSWILWLSISLYGMSGAMPHVLVPTVLAETLGLKRFGTLYGWIGMLFPIGLFLGPLIVGRIFDLTGSYRPGIMLCSGILLLTGIASFTCVAPQTMALEAPAADTTLF